MSKKRKSKKQKHDPRKFAEQIFPLIKGELLDDFCMGEPSLRVFFWYKQVLAGEKTPEEIAAYAEVSLPYVEEALRVAGDWFNSHTRSDLLPDCP